MLKVDGYRIQIADHREGAAWLAVRMPETPATAGPMALNGIISRWDIRAEVGRRSVGDLVVRQFRGQRKAHRDKLARLRRPHRRRILAVGRRML